ncbi:protein phosphatase 2C domain-containing protein [Georgenia sp. 10Sc9-8]|uniref:Protein phosphatase 2C domain-containing protein n=1 Tax=Georgenia halotolerans TaxID=3028317 RepID=A0ABT5TZG7_9MICO|nr:protein phosphatase 2C domain-containing protein [Georgenia halotolerans]
MRTQWGTATHAGGRRTANEDAFLAQPPVFAVADGMGGHARGDMASQTAVAVLSEVARQAGDAPARAAVQDAVQRAMTEAADRIRRTMAEDARGAAVQDAVAGTTVAGVVLTEQDGRPHWLVLNVGDSRVYRLTEGALEQVSVDHSLVQEMVDAGALSRQDARVHPQRNVITRAVGTDGEVEVDFWTVPVRAGDRYLLCTDGLLGELDEEEIATVLHAEADPEQAAATLVERAVAGTADDNVTVVVVDAAA